MREMKLFGWTGLTFLYAVFVIAALPALLSDFLFYRSDIFSFSVFVLAAALVIFPILGAIALALSRLPEKARSMTGRLAALIAAIGIVDIFLAMFTLYLVSLLNWKWLSYLIKHPVIALGVCILPAAFIIYKQADKNGLIERVKHVGCFALVLAPILIGYSILSSPDMTGERAAGTRNERHLVYLVLDGWPSQYLHAYNAQAPAGVFDEVLGDARVYLGAHSSAVWTSAYFGTLYNGDTQVVEGNRRSHQAAQSLGAFLQGRNVGVRFINFHRNGIPDSSSAHRSDHNGLRSYFLTEKFYWVPSALGLDYHLTLAGSAISQNFMWFVPRTLFDWLNQKPKTGQKKKQNILMDVLIPELGRIRKHHDKSFTLFHTSWNDIGSGGTADLSQIPKAQAIAAPSGDATTKIRANDYRYEPDYEPAAENLRRNTMRSILQQGEYIRDFIEALRKDPALSETVVILTADHGAMYAKGRYWYGYHPNREVVRVPFIVFDKGPKGTNAELFGTPQITAAIQEFYKASSTAGSFDLKGKADGPVISLTLSAHVQKEWYLVATYPDKAYWMNLHPEGSGMTREMEINGYDQTEASTFPGPPKELAEEFPTLLKSFGIDLTEAHKSFRR